MLGPATQQGAFYVYPGTWSVQGQGGFSRTEGRQTLRGNWTVQSTRNDAPINVVFRASDGKLLLQASHAQLRTQNAVQGEQVQLFDGVVTSTTPIGLEAFEWAFPFQVDSPSATGIVGQNSTIVLGSVAPMQVAGSQAVADCSWAFTNSFPQGGCNYSIAPANTTADWAGKVGTFLLSGANCPWASSSIANWLQVFPIFGSAGGNIQYTVFPNFTSAERTGSITIAGKSFPVTQARNPATQQARFIQMLYFMFLNRLPAADEIAFWEGQLAGGKTREQMALDFLNAQEFNMAGRFVAGLYVGILNRDAEFGGWLFQRNALTSGGVFPDGLVANFLNGDEFKLKNPSLTDANFIRLLYRQILLREPTQAEVDFQLTAIPAGRVVLARQFLNSAEFRLGTGPRLMAFLLHATLLFRDPATAERQALATQISSGVPLSTPVSAILNGIEFASLLK